MAARKDDLTQRKSCSFYWHFPASGLQFFLVKTQHEYYHTNCHLTAKGSSEIPQLRSRVAASRQQPVISHNLNSRSPLSLQSGSRRSGFLTPKLKLPIRNTFLCPSACFSICRSPLLYTVVQNFYIYLEVAGSIHKFSILDLNSTLFRYFQSFLAILGF